MVTTDTINGWVVGELTPIGVNTEKGPIKGFKCELNAYENRKPE